MSPETPLSSNHGGSTALRVLLPLAWIAAGFLLAVLTLVDPWNLHTFDDRLRGQPPDDHHDVAVPGHETHGHEAHQEELWTCGMHPQVLESEPGQCPICQMNLVPLDAGGDHVHGPVETAVMSTEATESVWTCPMHPEIVEAEAGSCPICGMDLVSKEVPAAPSSSMAAAHGTPDMPSADSAPVVRIDPAVIQNMNVRTARVERRDLRHPIRTVGYLEYDQERMVTVTTKYSGWIEKVHVNYVGEPVTKGQALFEIYSPELVQTQQELLSALDFAHRMENTPPETRRRAEALVDAARTRLSYWDISRLQIAELEATGEVFRTLTVRAPAGGLVMMRQKGLEGMAVDPGMETYHIADLSNLWLTVEIFEDQVAWVRTGTPAEVTFTYFPGETFRGAVQLIEPEMSEATRTLRVKIGVPNPGRRLRAGMYATVLFQPPAVAAALAVPSQAVLRTGTRNVAVVEHGGGFSPREIAIGYEGEGWAEVLSGLSEGERVVTSAQFLLDSEASLREAIRKMVAERRSSAGGPGGGHVGH